MISSALRFLACSTLAVWVMSFASRASAQPSHEADALFEQGLEDMRAGRYEAGCPRLAESYKLDPMPGALFTLAECEAAWGRPATALEHYQAFVTLLTALPPGRRDKFGERRGIALAKMAALAGVVPELTIDPGADAAAGLVVKSNGAVVAPSAYGVGRKVDPGTYVVTAEVDGVAVWERRVTLAERDRARVEIPAQGARAGAARAPAEAPAEASPSSSTSPGRKPWVYAAAGVGLAGLVTGGVAGTMALLDRGTIDRECPNHLCTSAGRSAVSAGQGAALVSTVGFGVGLSGVASAALLWLWPSSSPVAPTGKTSGRTLTPTVVGFAQGGGVGVTGAF